MTADVCRKHVIIQNTFNKWKAKCGGLNVSDAHKPKTLERQKQTGIAWHPFTPGELTQNTWRLPKTLAD